MKENTNKNPLKKEDPTEMQKIKCPTCGALGKENYQFKITTDKRNSTRCICLTCGDEKKMSSFK